MITKIRLVGYDPNESTRELQIQTKKGLKTYLQYLLSKQKGDSLDQRRNVVMRIAGQDLYVDVSDPIDYDAIVEQYTTLTTKEGINKVQAVKNRSKKEDDYVVPLIDRAMSLRNEEVIKYAKMVLKDNDFIPPYEPFMYLRKFQPKAFESISHFKDPDIQHDKALEVIEKNNFQSHYDSFNKIQKVKTNKLLYDLNVEHHNRFFAANNYVYGRANKTHTDFDSSQNCMGVFHYDKRGKIDSHFKFPVFDAKAKVFLQRFTNMQTLIEADRKAAVQMENYHKFLKRGEALGNDMTLKLSNYNDELIKAYTSDFNDNEKEITKFALQRHFNHEEYFNTIKEADEIALIKKIANDIDYKEFSNSEKEVINSLLSGKEQIDKSINKYELIEKLIKTGAQQAFERNYLNSLIKKLGEKKHHTLIYKELESLGIRLEQHSEKRKNFNHNKKGAKHGNVYFTTVKFNGVGQFDSRVLPKNFQIALNKYSEIKNVERTLDNHGNFKDKNSVHDYFNEMKRVIEFNKGKSLPEIQVILRNQFGISYMPVIVKDGKYQSANIQFSNKQMIGDAKASHVASKDEIEALNRKIVEEYLKAQKEQWDKEDLEAELDRQLAVADYNTRMWKNRILKISFKRLNADELNDSNLLFIYTNEYMRDKFLFDGKSYWKGKHKKLTIVSESKDSMTITANDDRFDTLLMSKELLFNRAIERWQTEKARTIISSTDPNHLAFYWVQAQLDSKLSKIITINEFDGKVYEPPQAALDKLNEEVAKANARARTAYDKQYNRLKTKRLNGKKGGDFYSFSETFSTKLHRKDLRQPAIEMYVKLINDDVKVIYPDVYMIEDKQEILNHAKSYNDSELVAKIDKIYDSLENNYDAAKAKLDAENNKNEVNKFLVKTMDKLENIESNDKPKSEHKPVVKTKDVPDNAKSSDQIAIDEAQFKQQQIDKMLNLVKPELDKERVGISGYDMDKYLLSYITIIAKSNLTITPKAVFEISKSFKLNGNKNISNVIEKYCSDNPSKENIKQLTKAFAKELDKRQVRKAKPRQ